MTLSQAAKRLGVQAGTLRVQIHNKKLRARKIGPIWTVSEREVERYRAASRRPAGHAFRPSRYFPECALCKAAHT